jgi:rfaE bifunctional protein kinase chain/domain
MNASDLIKQIVNKPPRIAVIGDYIEDRYIFAEVTRISPEAPVVVARKIGSTTTHGGAGNVWATLTNLGCEAYLFCDSTPEYWGEIHEHGTVFLNHNTHSVKTRVMSGNHHLLRIDEEGEESEIQGSTFQSLDWAAEFVRKLEDKELDCVVIADYHKGVVSKSVAEMVVAYCQDFGIPCIVDAKKDFGKFAGASIVKCNMKEASAIPDIWELIHESQFNLFVVTNGENGIDAYPNHTDEKVPIRVQGISVPIVDVCGAGDTVTAILAICMFSTYNAEQMISIANFAASEACRYPGVYLVTHEDLMKYDL